MKAISKDFWREIKNTKSRFLSIMVLVALAVAFLSGLKATAPDMKITGHNYFEQQKLFDIEIMSTVGLTDEDLQELLKKDCIEDAEACYVIDAFASTSAYNKVSKVYSIPEKEINLLTVLSGRLPEAADECVIDEDGEWELDVRIGDKLTLTPQESFEDSLTVKEYTVVGVVRSPIYVSVERGSASIGSGSVSTYIYVPKENFDSEIYTTIFARVVKDSSLIAFYDDYDNYIEDIIDSLEDFGNERAQLRYDSLVGKIDDAQTELDDARSDADEELAKAEKTLSDAEKEIERGKKEISDADAKIADADKEIADGEQELADAYTELTDGEKEYADGLAEYEDAVKEYEDGLKEYEDGLKEYEDGKADYEKGLKDYNSGECDYSYGYQNWKTSSDQVAAGRAQLEARRSGVDSLRGLLSLYNAGAIDDATFAASSGGIDAASAAASVAAFDATETQLNEAQAQVDAGAAALSKAASQLWDAEYELKKAKQKLDDAEAELADAKQELDDGKQELDDAKQELEDSRKKLDDGWQEYEDGKIELEEAKQKLADAKTELAKAKITLANGEADYEKGLQEYEDAKADADEKISDAQNKIDDARSDVEEIKEQKWYILSRSYSPGYSGLGQDADRMGNLASVFPVIFFLVAALVCLTTMTRMVEEQRIQIGCLKALGYGPFAISRKYIGYGLVPSLLGSLIGLAIGYTLFPTMIFTAYQIMYEIPDIELHAYGNISLACVLAAVACTTLSTLAACLAALRSNPASLMRPKTPAAGKRVLLERIGFIWKRLSFIHKVTVRNLFRYKKRFWMTVIGIGGCTALIIAGFGLRSSLTYILERQYGALTHYTAQITLESDLEKEKQDAIIGFIENDERITDYTRVRMTSLTASSDKSSQTAYLYVMNPDEVAPYFEIYDYKTGETLSIDGDGVYIDQKLSELLGVKVGDEIFLDGDEKTSAVVCGIYEHYTAHFIYVSETTYEKLFGKAADRNGVLMHFTDNDISFCNELFEDLMELDGVSGTSRITDVAETFIESMERIDFVVVIVIISAGALALVVLYNLSNINITERMREIATIKVLGFYDREVSAYVYRENIVLTIFGILLGILMGHYLHTWLVKSVEIDLMMFGRETDPMAYVYAAALTAMFSVLANVIAHFRMKKIDMVESLKSAE